MRCNFTRLTVFFYIARFNYTQSELLNFINEQYKRLVKNISVILNDVVQQRATATAMATAMATATAIIMMMTRTKSLNDHHHNRLFKYFTVKNID